MPVIPRILFFLLFVFVFASIFFFFVYAMSRALPRKVIRARRNDPAPPASENWRRSFFPLQWHPSNSACKCFSLAIRYVYLLLHYYLVISDWFNHVVARDTPKPYTFVESHCSTLSRHISFFFSLLILFASRPSTFFSALAASCTQLMFVVNQCTALVSCSLSASTLTTRK